MDVLADALKVTGMANTVLCQTTFYAPWGVGVDPSTEIMLHFVREGRCYLMHGDDVPRELNAGDIVMVTRGTAHGICDRPGRRTEPLETVLERMRRIEERGVAADAARTTVLCAKYRFDAPAPHPVMSRLPSVIHLRAEAISANEHLRLLLGLLNLEAADGASGTELVVPRLVDSLLVYVIRAWLEGEGNFARTWFAALGDPGVSAALSAIHARPEAGWTLESLAAHARQSRATFARRFNDLVGEPPIAYLTRWRMHLAARLLREERRRIEQVAQAVGYESAPAFTKAFKRHFELSPAHFRAQGFVRAVPHMAAE